MSHFYMDKPNGYSGQAYYVRIGAVNLYYSYNTLIAVRGPGGVRARRSNEWGPTTGKHINLLGIRDMPEVSEEELDKLAVSALAQDTSKLLFNV